MQNLHSVSSSCLKNRYFGNIKFSTIIAKIFSMIKLAGEYLRTYCFVFFRALVFSAVFIMGLTMQIRHRTNTSQIIAADKRSSKRNMKRNAEIMPAIWFINIPVVRRKNSTAL